MGMLCYTLFSIILKIGFENRKLTHFLQFCREIYSDSNNIVQIVSAQVATPIVTQVPVMPTVVFILISLGENP